MTTDLGVLRAAPADTAGAPSARPAAAAMAAPAAGPAAGSSVLAHDNGDGTYSAWLRSSEPGVATIRLEVNGTPSPSTASVTFHVVLEATLGIHRQPRGGLSGRALSVQPEIVLRGDDGQILADDDSTRVRVALAPPAAPGAVAGVLGGTLERTARGGVVSFDDLTLEGADNTAYTLVFTAIGTTNSVASDPVMVMTDAYAAAVRAGFEDAERGFVQRRMERMLALEPDQWQLDRRRGAGRGAQYRLDLATQGSGGAFRLGLEGRAGAPPAGHAEASRAGGPGAVDVAAEGDIFSADGRTRFWASATTSERVEDEAATGRTVTRFGMANLGADRLVHERLALGLMLQADHADETPAGGGRLRGNGWLAGPYLSAEIAPGLHLGLRGAVGASENTAELAPAGDGRLFTARFTTRRSLWRASLRGETRLGAMTLTPALDLAAMRETIPDHLAHDAWHSVAIGGGTVPTRRGAVSATAAFALGPGPEAPIFSLRPEWSASLVPEGAGTRRTQGWAIELGLRSGPGARWLHDISLRHDAQRGGARATAISLSFSRAF